ncbi:type IVB secretion system protein IcmH/DotU [Pseudoduganella sp. RAF53_2]|uniref:type IVB secretion system protein IcmH/DotU n=1 Tax=unclassified Pseudoduganella TaxID=2637179 RepID=UPI003F9E6757
MTPQIERRAAPSLFGAAASADGVRIQSLLDLMHEGFHMLFLLRNGSEPPACEEFLEKVGNFLKDFDRDARNLRAHGDDIDAAKYAFCAALDEIVLASHFPLRDAWEQRPLQLVEFGDQLAGEHFFDRLEALRTSGGARLQALQVFHMCLLLGFKGKYALDGGDRLAYMTARLGDEIAHIKGKSKGFAPRADRPDQVVHTLRTGLPLWALCSVFALLGIGVFIGLKSSLDSSAQSALAPYAGIVKLAPRPANLTITLP